MAEYICCGVAVDHVYDCCLESKSCNLNCIKDIPAADVVARDCYDRLLVENDELRKERPVRHGRWMCECFDPAKYGDCEYHVEEYTGQSHHVCNRPYCSSCAEDIPLNGGENYWITRFCPNCGADMREVEHENC